MEIPTKIYVDNKFNDPSIKRNTVHVAFNDKIPDNVRFVNINSMPAVGEHLTSKNCFDKAIFYSVNESSLLKLDPDENIKQDEQDCRILNSTSTIPRTIIEIPTKNYVDSLHENRRNRRDLSTIFNDQDKEFDDKN